MEAAPKSFWGKPAVGEPRTSPLDDVGLRTRADLIRIAAMHGVDKPTMLGYELWELAAASGHYLGPTHEEQKIEDMYAHEEELKAAMIERAKRRQQGEYDSQDMPAVKVR